MKYTCEILIKENRDIVVENFNKTDNLYKWQKGLKSFEILEGEPGVDGLKSKLTYEMNGKLVDMVETIEKFNFPNEMIAIYQAKNVWNRCINTFEDQGDQTLYRMETEFICSGWMRLITIFGKKMFMKQTLSDMNAFKDFVEGL